MHFSLGIFPYGRHHSRNSNNDKQPDKGCCVADSDAFTNGHANALPVSGRPGKAVSDTDS